MGERGGKSSFPKVEGIGGAVKINLSLPGPTPMQNCSSAGLLGLYLTIFQRPEKSYCGKHLSLSSAFLMPGQAMEIYVRSL